MRPKFRDSAIAVGNGRSVSSGVLRNLHCFCPELLFEIEDQHVSKLFDRLLQVLERSGSLSPLESKSAVEKFVTFVVAVQACHSGSGRSAEETADTVM